jgi:soluble lytic murein transglycosylase
MSNERPLKTALFVALSCLAGTAHAQSKDLLEAVRVHRATARSTAEAEYSACAGADVKKACPDATRLSLLLGFLELSEGDAAAAVDQLKSRPAPKGLEAIHAWYLGEAQAWAGKKDEALKTFARAGKTPPSWLKKRLDARTAELLVATHKFKEALPLFETLDVDASAELLYARGTAKFDSGDREGGLADFKALTVKNPAHPDAVQAAMRLANLNRTPTFGFEERLARAAAYVAAGEAKTAQAELEGVEVPKDKREKSATARLHLAKASVLFALGQQDDAFLQLDDAMGGPSPIAADAMMIRARRLMKGGENRLGREVLLSLDEKYPKEAPAEEAGYLASWLAMQAGEFERAVSDFERFESRHPESRKRDEARWFRAFSLIRLGQHDKARALLATLLDDFPRSALVPQARYWMIRSAQLSLDASAADGGVAVAVAPADAGTFLNALKRPSREQLIADYKTLIGQSPGSFYALLSQERLRELGEDAPATFSEPPKVLKVAPPADLKLAQELARTGLFHDSQDEVATVIQGVGNSEGALRYGHALQGLGDYGAAYTLAARWLWGAVFTQRVPEAVALMYPRAYQETVEKQSHDHGLDPFMAWAIMRRESAFRPEVSSVADARGLMQLIPPTANAIAKELNIEAPAPDELYSPEENVTLGTWYLSALLNRFQGHPSLCAAAYNAGAKPVLHWAQERQTLPLDIWVEEIPYKETRGYVKQVTADYYIYQALYGPKAERRLSMEVPAPRETGVAF